MDDLRKDSGLEQIQRWSGWGAAILTLLLSSNCSSTRQRGDDGSQAGASGTSSFVDPSSCTSEQYYLDSSCGADPEGAGAFCEWFAESCDDVSDPKCGCDGRVYKNACEAKKAGVTTSELGKCDVPEGRYACGESFCLLDAEMCEVFAASKPTPIDTGRAAFHVCGAVPKDCPHENLGDCVGVYAGGCNCGSAEGGKILCYCHEE